MQIDYNGEILQIIDIHHIKTSYEVLVHKKTGTKWIKADKTMIITNNRGLPNSEYCLLNLNEFFLEALSDISTLIQKFGNPYYPKNNFIVYVKTSKKYYRLFNIKKKSEISYLLKWEKIQIINSPSYYDSIILPKEFNIDGDFYFKKILYAFLNDEYITNQYP